MAKSNNKSESFEKTLFKAADKLRKNMDAAEYKHIVLGLIFLKFISDSFEEMYTKLSDGKGDYVGADPEDADEYRAENVFFVPQTARWSYLYTRAKLPTIGTDIDSAMEAIEKENPTLKGILPKVYARPNLDKAALGGLLDLIGNIALGDEASKAKDLLGKVYEYFLGEFALAEGKKGGQFYTPRSVVQLLVEMLEPYKGRVFDPCCGSGGMFVMSEKFVQSHQGKIDDISIYGQESNQTTYRLCRMNLAIRGIDGSQVKWNNEGSFLNDAHKDLKADFVIANPPFNDSDWSGELLQNDGRWKYGKPSSGNANFAWVQHFIYHLAPNGSAGFVLANSALSSESETDGLIRKTIIDNDLVDCIVSLPDKLFYSTPIPASLWFLTRNKNKDGERNRKNEILFIDAEKMFKPINRTANDIPQEFIERISKKYHDWKSNNGEYSDEPGFCKSIKIEAVAIGDYSLFPAQYVGFQHTKDQYSSSQIQEIGNAKWLAYRDSLNHLIEADKEISKMFLGNGDICLPIPTQYVKLKLKDILEPVDERLGDSEEPEILTCTEKAGLILQRERFAKRVATDNTSKYKVVQKTDIVYNPYLLWAGAIDQCWVVEKGITSPAYEIFRVKNGFNPTLVGKILKSELLLKMYNGISIGTVKRRRRAPAEKFLNLEIEFPSLNDQEKFARYSSALQKEIEKVKMVSSTLSDFINELSTVWINGIKE